MISLRLVPVSGNPIDVTRDPSLVGRDPTCEVVVTDGSVSRRHARLERRSGEWWVVDQGSANGTYVNSLKVAETALKNAQELRFGALAFRVDIAEDAEATVSSPVFPEETVMATPAVEPTPPPSPVVTPPPPPPPPPRGATAAGDRFRPAGSAAPVPQMSGGAPPAKKGRGPVFWIAIGCTGCLVLVVLLVGLVSGGLFFMQRGAVEAAESQIELVRQGDTETAYAGLSSALRAELSFEDYERLIAEHPSLQDNADVTFNQRSVTNERAEFEGWLTSTSGEKEPVTIVLAKEGGTWKITALRLGPGED